MKKIKTQKALRAAAPGTTVAILEGARAKIVEGWTTGWYARNKSGAAVEPPTLPEATCWCMLGALRVAGAAQRCEDSPAHMDAHGLLMLIVGDTLDRWQDTEANGVGEVLAAFDAAEDIAAAVECEPAAGPLNETLTPETR